MIPFLNRDETMCRTDIGTIPWDLANNRPKDHNGKASRDWKALMVEHNITEPEAYKIQIRDVDGEKNKRLSVEEADQDTLIDAALGDATAKTELEGVKTRRATIETSATTLKGNSTIPLDYDDDKHWI